MTTLKFLVTSALPYANGPIHLGHVAGAYLPADVFVRFQRLIGNEVVYICGTDEHGVPITLSAQREGVSPETIVKRYHSDIHRAFQRLHIEFDNFSGTSYLHNPYHHELAQTFFINLLNKGWLRAEQAQQHYCPQCQQFLADRFLEGTCPRCSFDEARGDECSQCNAQFEPLQLGAPRCKICGNAPQVQDTRHWYLLLDQLQPQLEKWIAQQKHWKENVLRFVQGWFKEGLRPRAVTRDLSWGIPVPLPDANDKVLYVWFDAPIGYISATMQWAQQQGQPDLWKAYWQDQNTRLVHFIGKDNIPFHAIIWPAILMAQPGYILPWDIPANEYLTFRHVKGSKSKGNAVGVHEALDAVSCDALRFYLAAKAPERSDTDFSWTDFQQKVNSELLGVLGNLANRILKFAASHFNGRVPRGEHFQPCDQELLALVRQTKKQVQEYYSHFRVREAVASIVALGRKGNQYFDTKAPWSSRQKDPADCAACLYVGLQLVQTLAITLAPVLPIGSQHLWQQLGYSQTLTCWEEPDLRAGHQLGRPQALFAKIENDLINRLEQRQRRAAQSSALATSTKAQASAKAQASTKAQVSTKAQKPTISYEEFAKLDIRIGTITQAQKVPHTDRLLQLKVDLGARNCQIVAGVAHFFTPAELIGRRVPVLVNLQTAKIRGIESQGMLLCADVDGRAVLLHPAQEVPNGCVVR